MPRDFELTAREAGVAEVTPATVSTYGGERLTLSTRISDRVEARTRKIAILGFDVTGRDAPWGDPSWEFWGMNGLWRILDDLAGQFFRDGKVPLDRFSVWFDIHTLDYTRAYGQQVGIGDAQEKWLAREDLPFPIYMLDREPEVPQSQPYPIDEVIEKGGRDYFTSTPAYALGLAYSMADELAEVGIWGVSLTHAEEYQEQRPCAEYWLRALEDKGVKITIHPESALLRQTHRYGYAPQDPVFVAMYRQCEAYHQEITAAREKALKQHEELTAQLHHLDGGLQLANEMMERLKQWRRGGRIG